MSDQQVDQNSASTPQMTAGSNKQCALCFANIHRDEVVSAVKAKMDGHFNTYLDQFETAMHDDLDHEVNPRPAARQRAVCTP